jgi:hypothetical protein
MTRPIAGWLHPGWSWTMRYPRVIPAGYSVASLFLGLGGSAGVTLSTGGLHADQFRRVLWLLIVGVALAVVFFSASEIVRRGRDRMLKRNGTAFVVTEPARDWDADEHDDFESQVKRHFAQVIKVPGPGLVEPPWEWPLDEGARQWDVKVTDLTQSFRTLHLSGLRVGAAEGVFVTAWWAVALALGRRVQAADRGLDLSVWQRPSNARAGEVEPRIWSQKPHRFAGSAEAPQAGLATEEHQWRANITVKRHGRGGAGGHAGEPLAMLLARFGGRDGQPSQFGADPGPVPRTLTLEDAAKVLPAGTSDLMVHELRCVPPGDPPQFPWTAYPYLAASALSWIQRKHSELPGHTLLLAAVMPNEVALGIGISAGRESCTTWPGYLWPVIYRKPGKSLHVPRLNLGTARIEE